MGLGELWDQLVDCVCRPPRDTDYTEANLMGGAAGVFVAGQLPGQMHPMPSTRVDLELVNPRGQKLRCSHFLPTAVRGLDGRLPCVVYCHTNSGSRRDCHEALDTLLPYGVSVFSMDFAGCGLSEGDWVTLGAYEVDDVATAVQYLRDTGTVSTVGLWGRSMGAVTALLYSQRDPSVACIVLDSPFSDLSMLMLEIVERQEFKIPRPLMKMALAAMKRSVKKRAGFDISEVSPVSVVPQSFIPALFCHGKSDEFVRIHHSRRLFEAYAGDKKFFEEEGEHNSPRTARFLQCALTFFLERLQVSTMVVEGGALDAFEKSFKAAAARHAAAVAASASHARPAGVAARTHSGGDEGGGDGEWA